MARPILHRPKKLCLVIGLLAAAVGCESSRKLDRGDALLAEGKPGEAIDVWREDLAASPTDTDLLTRIATAQTRLGRLDEAEATMLRAVAIEPESAKVRHNLALVYLKQENLDKALATFHEVLDLEATYPDANFYVGLIHEIRGDQDAAVPCYVREVNHGPSSRAWARLQVFRERERELGLVPRGPEPGSLTLLCVGLLGLAALAYGLHVYLVRRQEKLPSDPGS